MSNIGWGGLTGILMGVLTAAIVTLPVVFASEGSTVSAELWVLAGIYVVGGLVSGIIGGALGGRVKTWYQAGLLGVLAILPIVFAMVWLDSGWNGAEDLEAVGVVSVVLGFPLGVIARQLIIRVDPFGDIEL